jgi:hypothetical protein
MGRPPFLNVLKGVVMVAATLSIAACSGGGSEESAAARESLGVCRETFGGGSVDALSAKLGDDMRAKSAASPDLSRGMLRAARKWVPDSGEYPFRDKFNRCSLEWNSGGKASAAVHGTVRWSTVTMDMARRGVAHWEKAADDVYVAPIGGYGHSMAVPCEVAGTASGQRAQLLLETQLWGSGLENADSALRARMLKSFATHMQKLLDCTSTPRIPDGVALPETSFSGPN